ncbi:ATP-binding protein [Nonomuraea thailandensis]
MTSAPAPLRHQRGLTEQAADAALDQACRLLRGCPPSALSSPATADAAEREQLTYRGFLAELLMAECEDRQRRRSERRIRAAGFPGRSGCRTALGTEAAMAGLRVKYVLAARLVNELVEAADELVLNKTIARYGRVDLLCIDELGCLELDKRGADLLFHVLTDREETASVAIASNESFGGWTETFTDPRLCAAIVDRLTCNATIIETGTDSYRLARTRAQQTGVTG